MTTSDCLLKSAALGLFRRCYKCNANLGLARFAKKLSLCPHCWAVLKPSAMWLGPQERLIIAEEALRPCRHKYARAVGVFAVAGLRIGADQLILEPTESEYRLSVSIDDETFRLCPPPPHLCKRLPSVMKAIAGMNLNVDNSMQKGEVVIKRSEDSSKSWSVTVTIDPGIRGETIAFEYPEKSEPDFELLYELASDCPEYLPEND